MAEKLVREYINVVLLSISRIEDYLDGIDKEAMIADYRISDGVERNLEKMSEATRWGIPQELRDTEPDIPWRQIEAIGNVLRHAYDRVNLDILWSTVHDDIPLFKEAIERIRELDLEQFNPPMRTPGNRRGGRTKDSGGWEL